MMISVQREQEWLSLSKHVAEFDTETVEFIVFTGASVDHSFRRAGRSTRAWIENVTICGIA
jgi:hypothetical protein